MQVALLVLALVACAAAGGTYEKKPIYPSSGYEKNKGYDYAPANYNFDYAVKDDYYYVNFGANEYRNGDNTQGYYYVQLSDGRLQKVKYYVDGYSGYVAEVTYEGEPKYGSDYNAKPYSPVYAKPGYSKKNYNPVY